jgi:type II secretory pathway pseudopilin PulG
MKPPPRPSPTATRTGFSTVELVIGVLIIAILVGIAVPVLRNRAKQARIAATLSDLESLADAQQRLAIDAGVYIRLFALDDIWIDRNAGDGLALAIPNDPDDTFDALQEELLGTANYYYEPTKGSDPEDVPGDLFINPTTQDLIDVNDAAPLWNRLTVFSPSVTITSLVWHGPYMAWQKDSDVLSVEAIIGRPLNPGESALDDIPDDAWGNNYLFFTALGLINEPEGVLEEDTITVEEALGKDTAANAGGDEYDTDLFDRPTILSLGPDGLPGDIDNRNFGAGDDQTRSW